MQTNYLPKISIDTSIAFFDHISKKNFSEKTTARLEEIVYEILLYQQPLINNNEYTKKAKELLKKIEIAIDSNVKRRSKINPSTLRHKAHSMEDQDLPKAIALFKYLSVEIGDVDSQRRLGRLYEVGDAEGRLEVNIPKAIKYYTMAALLYNDEYSIEALQTITETPEG